MSSPMMCRPAMVPRRQAPRRTGDESPQPLHQDLRLWSSITVVIASPLVTGRIPHAVPSGSLPDRLHELQVRGAIAVLELKGPEAFEQHRKQLDAASRLRTYYLDEQGTELNGQSVPERLLSFAKEHQKEINDGERVMVGGPSRLAIPIIVNGKKYLALVESNRASERDSARRT